MNRCSRIVRQIRMSIAAIVVLFMLGGMVMGSSLMLFDFKLKVDNIPKSMTTVQQSIPWDGTSVWFILLLVSASVGLPLMMYVISTLHNCENELEPPKHFTAENGNGTSSE